jgi:hypothetical protein
MQAPDSPAMRLMRLMASLRPVPAFLPRLAWLLWQELGLLPVRQRP